MATLGQTPEGLIARGDLPAADPLALAVWPRAGLAAEIPLRAADALDRLLRVSATRSAASDIAHLPVARATKESQSDARHPRPSR
jgi:hypothetical protein